jgi:hypothetical protein
MGKHNENVNRSGTCLTPGCGKPRDAGTWYCHGCNRDFRAEQDKRRGSAGTYPESWTTLVNGKAVDYDTKITIENGKVLDEPILMKNGKVVSGGHRDQAPAPPKKIVDAWKAPWKGGGGGGVEWGPQTKMVGGRPACDNGGQGHDGRTPFHTLAGGKVLYGARGSNLAHANLEHLDLIIDCAGVVAESGRFVKSAPARYRGLKDGLLPDVIRLDWPDMSAPVHVGIRWWMRLLELLPAHTCVCCVGGHGRTGTALAALLVASGMDAETAIRTVREQHCRRAIETQGQEAYVKGLAKAKVAIDTVVINKPEPVKVEGV